MPHSMACLQFSVLHQSHPALVLLVLSWQNQLLAKGLSFVEEKIKLCEGKYPKALVRGALTQPRCLQG